jgi:hypothetical protein
VTPGDELGRLVGLEQYWVVVAIPLEKRRWLSLPDAPGQEQASAKQGSEVRIRNPAAWPEGAERRGRLDKLIGTLDEETRMARMLVVVSDPLALDPEAAAGTPQLMVGEFVEVRIQGNELTDVVRIDRAHLRDDDRVWLFVDGKLVVRKVSVLLKDADHAYVSAGLEHGDRVVTTHLSTVTDGVPLRLQEPESGG